MVRLFVNRLVSRFVILCLIIIIMHSRGWIFFYLFRNMYGQTALHLSTMGTELAVTEVQFRGIQEKNQLAKATAYSILSILRTASDWIDNSYSVLRFNFPEFWVISMFQ